jgi:hypothetical protein
MKHEFGRDFGSKLGVNPRFSVRRKLSQKQAHSHCASKYDMSGVTNKAFESIIPSQQPSQGLPR